MSADRDREFVIANTERARTPLVPELSLRLATETTALWNATESWLDARGVPPPYWAFAWAGGQALARFVLDHPDVVRGRSILDFGCGGGLVALAAKHAGARSVLAVDCDALALVACAINARDNDLDLDVAHANTLDAVGPCDVVLAGDVFYDREAGPAVIGELRARARAGTLVLAGCPGRVLTPSLSEDAEIVFECTVPGVLELEGRESRIARVFRLAH